MSRWPSGLRRAVKVRILRGVGSNPTRDSVLPLCSFFMSSPLLRGSHYYAHTLFTHSLRRHAFNVFAIHSSHPTPSKSFCGKGRSLTARVHGLGHITRVDADVVKRALKLVLDCR